MKKSFMKGGYSLDPVVGFISVGGVALLVIAILDITGATNVFGKSGGGTGKRL